MYYNQNHQNSGSIAKKALERIKSENLPSTPDIFELWYVYYAQLNPEVSHAIDLLKDKKEKPTYETCQSLHKEFLAENTQSDRVKEAGDRIAETIKNVGGAVVSAKNAAKDYSDSLEDMSSKLAGKKVDAKIAKSVIDGAVSTTQAMMKQNQALESELNKSTEVMRELQRDLEMVKKEALTDGLTGLSNRKAFDAEIVRIKGESDLEKTKFSLLMMDIDHFKSFNDCFGHQVGDQVLRLVSHTLTDGVKGRDFVARYGGEEFAVILPATDMSGAMNVANALRNAVELKEVVNKTSGKSLGRITLSGGVAEYDGSEDIETLIGRADKALYAAKRNGRNQISEAQ